MISSVPVKPTSIQPRTECGAETHGVEVTRMACKAAQNSSLPIGSTSLEVPSIPRNHCTRTQIRVNETDIAAFEGVCFATQALTLAHGTE
jgi:hypothetical protein